MLLDTGAAPEPVLSTRFSGTVAGLLGENESGFQRARIRTESGPDWQISFRLPGLQLPIRAGEAYEFQVDYAGGFPDASGLLIRDAHGLLFAAASDQRLGARVLREGVPGFELELLAATCESRGRSRCYASLRNAGLRVARGERSVVLFQGESQVLDGYRVVVLTAQEVVYERGCADAGQIAVSWVILRDDRPGSER